MPETLYFGLAVSAKSSSSTTTAQFRNLVSAVPAAPANFDANATDATEINLTWDASTGATIYRIERKGPGESAFSEIGTTVGTSFLDNNLVPNSLYSYRIRAGNNVGLSEYSQVIDETTPSPTVPPTAPTNLLAQAVSQTKVQLSWTDTSALETSFDILRSTNGVDFTSVGQAAANATSFNDLTVQAGTLYYYQVKAVNGAGESPASNTSQTTTPEVDSYTSVDINATPPGETLIYVADTEYDVSAGGLDIWSTADGFRYVYRTLTGDFDMKMQVQSLTGVSPSIKAGLMVRESLDAGSRSIFAGVTQSDGYRLSYRSSTNGSTFNKYKGGTATFPNAWIRLRRAGNIFAGFVSTDGINWTSISTVTMALPDTLHFGMALTGKSSTALATAEFRNLGTYTPPPSGPPSATIVQVGTEPQPDPVSSVTIEFSQPITGFELNDLVLTRDGASVSLTGATLASNDNMTWTLGNLAPSTDRVGTYNLTLLAGSVANADGLLLPASASTSWMMNSLAGTGAADLVRLVRNGSVTDYYLNDQLQYSFDAAPLGTLLIDGSGGDDLLTLDLSSGDPVSSSITFDGGLGQDTVAIIGTAAASQVSFDTTSVSAGGTTLTHSAVERRTFDGGGSVLVNAGEVELLATQSLLGLTIGDGASAVVPAAGALRTLRTDNLSIAANGRLDLNDNDLVVTDGDFAAIQALVFQGFGGTTGITSSTSNGSQILALFDNALAGLTEWNGQTVAPNAIIGRYTFFGDANLDGQVTGDDYTVIDSNLDTDPPVGLEWLSGDMNLDGIVTGDDYTVIDSNLGLAELASRPLAPSSLFSVKPIEISSEEDEDPERMADMLT
jgi:hypothetical protein